MDAHSQPCYNNAVVLTRLPALLALRYMTLQRVCAPWQSNTAPCPVAAVQCPSAPRQRPEVHEKLRCSSASTRYQPCPSCYRAYICAASCRSGDRIHIDVCIYLSDIRRSRSQRGNVYMRTKLISSSVVFGQFSATYLCTSAASETHQVCAFNHVRGVLQWMCARVITAQFPASLY